MAKCHRKIKECSPSICFTTKKDNYICSGISKKPSKFHKDFVWLCLKGKYAETKLEMTKGEALGIISVLTGSLFGMEALEKEVND